MAEKHTKVTPMRVEYMCDNIECLGLDYRVIYTGKMLMSHPPLLVHECPACKKQYNLTKKYPTIEYI